MKIKYDPEVDVIRITLKDVAIEESMIAQSAIAS
jgi:uncharacterized protein YuzE